MLAQKLAGLGIDQPHVQAVPLHLHLAADPAGRRAVVGRFHFDAAVQVHRAFAVAVVAKRLERQLAQSGLLLGKHHRDLTLGGAVDARVRPAFFPAIEVGLRLVDAFEAQPLERRPLRVTHARLDLALAIGIADATRQRDRTVVGQHVAVERVELRVVHVRLDDAFAEVVEHHDARRSSQPAKGALVELGPDLRARARHEQPHRLPRVAERHHEEPRPSVLARAWVPDHRSVAAVVDLRFLARRGRDHHARLDWPAAAELQHEALHARVARLESRGRPPGPARSPPRSGRGSAPPRSARGMARRHSHSAHGQGSVAISPAKSRWTPPPQWPVLNRGRWTPPPWWPVLKPQGRWTPPWKWPVLESTPLQADLGRAPASPAAFRYALAVSRRTAVCLLDPPAATSPGRPAP